MADENQIRDAVAQAIMDDSEVAEPTAAAALADPKDLFCKNWDTVKQVLLFLKPRLPALVRAAVDVIIKVGDALKKILC
ncbi:MAG TPA: hypothetical protein VF718_03920 [Allosphingosinicella sp.]|jgi:hypothetical protein